MTLPAIQHPMDGSQEIGQQNDRLSAHFHFGRHFSGENAAKGSRSTNRKPGLQSVSQMPLDTDGHERIIRLCNPSAQVASAPSS
jgi:hypothetical protein